jgi:hypothetical protein
LALSLQPLSLAPQVDQLALDCRGCIGIWLKLSGKQTKTLMKAAGSARHSEMSSSETFSQGLH